jgi:DNA primase
MKIPEEKIEEIRRSADIVDIISGYVQLKKRGRNYIGLCPFHQEKTPSFTVSAEKQIFHCFGCHAGGNAFSFLMDYKNISFVEAVQEIAEQLGIQLTYEKTEESLEQTEQESLFELNVFAARWFSDILLKSDDGEVAREYFKKRNIKLQTQKSFGLGFAPYGWDHFLNYAKENKIDLVKAKTLGLIDTRDDGGYYDKFRGRVIFPVFSPNGRVIAFGGRILDKQDNVAKYLNSPESLVYSKRKSLYGLYHSKEEIRKLDRAIVVEGYMDLISLYQHGVKNVVASSGTSFTEDQVQLLSRFTKNVILLFDADTAGQKASMRSIELLLKQNFEVKIASLPNGEDPDSFINNSGREEFNNFITGASNFLEYQTMQFEKAGMFEDPAQQTEAIRELVKSAALIGDELKRNITIKTIARKFNLREKLIETELNKLLQQQQEKEGRVIPQRAEVNETPARIMPLKENPFEKSLMRLLLGGDLKIAGYIFDNILPEEFINPRFRAAAIVVYESMKSGSVSPSLIVEKIADPDLNKMVFEFAFSGDSISKKWDELTIEGEIEKDSFKYAVDSIKNFKIFRIDEQLKLNNQRISKSTDETETLDLFRVNKELLEEKRTLSDKS